MKKRIEILALASLVVAGLAFVALTRPAPEPPLRPADTLQAAELARTQETTIRNVTDRTITYKIYPVGRPEALETRTIAPNAIDRFRTASSLEIEFHTSEKDVIYSLDPGKPYSFRYDQETTVELFLGSHGRADAADLAPYVPTPQAVVDKMLEMAAVTAKDVLYDLGCGDGRIVISAARKYGARSVGIDLDKDMIEASRRNARAAGVEPLVRFICLDATKADVSEATVLGLYLLPESLALLRPMFERQLRPGTRVVSHNYQVAGWENKQVQAIAVKDEDGEDHNIFLYIL